MRGSNDELNRSEWKAVLPKILRWKRVELKKQTLNKASFQLIIILYSNWRPILLCYFQNLLFQTRCLFSCGSKKRETCIRIFVYYISLHNQKPRVQKNPQGLFLTAIFGILFSRGLRFTSFCCPRIIKKAVDYKTVTRNGCIFGVWKSNSKREKGQEPCKH